MKSGNIIADYRILIGSADKSFAAGDFRNAFSNYVRGMAGATDVGLILYCKVKMLICQFKERTIGWSSVIVRAGDLKVQLNSVIERAAHNKASFDALHNDMHNLLHSLGTLKEKLAYSSSSAKLFTKRLKNESLYRFAGMMEMEPFNFDAIINHIDKLYDELKKLKCEDDILAELSEKKADVCRGYAEEIGGDAMVISEVSVNVSLQKKKQLYRLAVESYENALLHWKGDEDLFRKTEICLSVLNVLTDSYQLALEEKSKTYQVEVLILMAKFLSRKEVAELSIKPEKIDDEIALDVEIAENRAWYLATLAEHPELKDSILMPSPAIKKRFAGLMLYTPPATVPALQQVEVPDKVATITNSPEVRR